LKKFNIQNSKIKLGKSISRDKIDAEIGELYSKVIFITDLNLYSHYSSFLDKYGLIKINPGEKSKNLDVVSDIIEEMIEIGADRNSILVGFGGGVVCDITGFVSSVYMRGIDFGYVSTSLLSQVDASLGGKTGVNFKQFKNMIGIFNQPKFVICNIDYLRTLSDEEFLNGMGEVVKHAIISDVGYFDFIRLNIEKVLNRDENIIIELISKSIEIKSNIVLEDEKEKGVRKILNFGHTFGHAIESKYGIKHGFSVVLGMLISLKLSQKLGFIELSEIEKIIKLFMDLKILHKDEKEILKKENILLLLDLIKNDKKKNDNNVDLILIKNIGNAVIYSISFDDIEKML